MTSAKNDEHESGETTFEESMVEAAAPSDVGLLVLAVGALATLLIKRRRRRRAGHR